MMMHAVFLLFCRVNRTPSYQLLQLLRTASDTASSGLIGSSMIKKSPPRPVSVPPTDVAMRKPRLVVANSVTAFLLAEMRVPGNRRRYQSLSTIARQSSECLFASSCA